MPPQPPLRATHATPSSAFPLTYDRWGLRGRPVVLLHGLLFDRMMWWPVAAELAGDCTVIAPDLPGHGQSPVRDDYSLRRIAWDVAALVDSLGLRRAPIVVGHGTSAWLATRYAERFATHHALLIDEPVEAVASVDDVIAAAHLDVVPEQFRSLVEPRRDAALLTAYATWFDQPSLRHTSPARPAAMGEVGGGAGYLPHLCEPKGFAANVRDLL